MLIPIERWENIVLSDAEKERYNRQIMLFGEEGQKKLKAAKVGVIGVGGLGTNIAQQLVFAGVGNILLIDKDPIERSNLNRQVLYTEEDIGKMKIDVAVEKLRKANPFIKITGKKIMVDDSNVDSIIKDLDLVIDGLDNWETRMIINSACVRNKKPFIHAGIEGLYGQLLVVIPRKTPCLYCIFGAKKNVQQKPFPVLGVTPAIMANLQVMEALKLITGFGKPALNKLIIYDGYYETFSEIDVKPNENCPVCGRL